MSLAEAKGVGGAVTVCGQVTIDRARRLAEEVLGMLRILLRIFLRFVEVVWVAADQCRLTLADRVRVSHTNRSLYELAVRK